MTAALVGVLLVLGGAYWQAMRAAGGVPGRHRLSALHPGFESAPEELAALLRARRGE